MSPEEKLNRGGEVAKSVLLRADRPDELVEAIRELSDEDVVLGVSMVAVTQARRTRGRARVAPDLPMAEVLLDTADESGFAGVCEVADAFSSRDVRQVFANLAHYTFRQAHQEIRAADSALNN
jgi:hypothetical protein